MKFLAVIALVFLAGSTVKADVSLAQAMVELREVLRLGSWVAAWDVRRNADNAVCLYSNELNAPTALGPAFARILSDPLYQFIAATMSANGVPWDQFIEFELKPALGYHSIVPSCTTSTFGGVLGLRNQLRGYFDENLVKSTVDRLIATSSDFAQLQATISENQAGIRTIRCSPEVNNVYNIKRNQGVDFEFVFEVVGIIFGWGTISAC